MSGLGLERTTTDHARNQREKKGVGFRECQSLGAAACSGGEDGVRRALQLLPVGAEPLAAPLELREQRVDLRVPQGPRGAQGAKTASRGALPARAGLLIQEALQEPAPGI